MIYADLHCDTLTEYPSLRRNQGQLDLERSHTAGARLVCFAAFLRYDSGDLFGRALAYADKLAAELAGNADIALPVRCAADLAEAVRQDKVGAMFTIEEGGVVEQDPSRLATLYAKGLRMMTLTWNFVNRLGYPNCDEAKIAALGEAAIYMPQTKGLTELGGNVVAEMNRLGILVDVSHLSDGGFWDVMRLSKSPVVASHSNARMVRGVSRNLTDEMISALAQKGGVTGLNLCPDFLCVPTEDVLAAAVRHVEHIYQVGGEDVLAFGADFDGTSTRYPLRDCTAVPTLLAAVERRLGARIAAKMAFGNFARVFGEVCG